MNKTGVIYILTNPSFPQYVKIGYADDVDRLLNEYKFLTYDELDYCIDAGTCSKVLSFFQWYVAQEVDDDLNDFNELYSLYIRRQEIVYVKGFYTLRSIKNKYCNLTIEEINNIRNSIPIKKDDIRLKKISIIDLLINISYDTGPKYIYMNH